MQYKITLVLATSFEENILSPDTKSKTFNEIKRAPIASATLASSSPTPLLILDRVPH